MEDVLGWLAAGMSRAEILSDYPDLEEADIVAALSYAQRLTQTKRVVGLQ